MTERGTTFGYNDLVVDFRGLVEMRALRAGLLRRDALRAAAGRGRGRRAAATARIVAPLARAAVAVGIDALFVEAHPDPERAPCDGPSQIDFAALDALLGEVRALERALAREPSLRDICARPGTETARR